MAHPGRIIALSGRDPQPSPPRWRLKPEPELTRLQGYMALWREGWDPAPRDERWIRAVAGICSLLAHLLLIVALLVIAAVQLSVPPVPDSSDGERIRIGIVDAAASEQDSPAGGGQADRADDSAPAPVSRSETSPEASRFMTEAASPADTPSAITEVPDEPLTVPEIRMPPLPVSPTPAIAPPQTDVVQRQVAEPSIPAPQPVQVTQVETPASDHVLPPVNMIPRPEIPVTPIRPVEAQFQPREVTVVIPPAVTPSPVRTDSSSPAMPTVEPPVREREVAAPLSQVPVPQVQPPVAVSPQLPAASVLEVRPREVQVRPPSSTTVSAGVSPGFDAVPTPATPVSPAMGDSPARTDTTASAPSPANTAAASAPGVQGQGNAANRDEGWGRAQHNDDWSAGARDNAGHQRGLSGAPDGLFGADGRVNLGEADLGKSTAAAGSGNAPGTGTDHWNRDTLDRSGSWRRSPPNDFTPTSFDAYWIPNESLLSEWVRKGIKEISIPIPGTRTRLQCVISILQVGGGCGLHNPNLNDQPAVARPPPEIPFKPEWQEDNGSAGAPLPR